MRRRLFNLLAAISLLLCLATIGLWVRSLLVLDILRWTSPGRTTLLCGHCHGLCWFEITRLSSIFPGFSNVYGNRTSREELVTSFRSYPTHIEFAGLLWFAGSWSSTPGAPAEYGLAIPMWYLIAAFAILPAWAAQRHFTRRPTPGLSMRRRRVLNLLAIGSLILCLVMAGLWVRALIVGPERLTWTAASGESAWICGHGAEFCWVLIDTRPFPGGSPGLSHMTDPRVSSPFLEQWWRSYISHFEFIGVHTFAGCSFGPPGDYTEFGLAIPVWYLIAAFAILPAWAIERHVNRRPPPAPGTCPKCGYDLRATPERCPECGTVPAATTQQAAKT